MPKVGLPCVVVSICCKYNYFFYNLFFFLALFVYLQAL